MKIWIISDTHSFHEKLTVPKCDMVIFCGDESNYLDPVRNEIETRDFFKWFCGLDIEYKLFTPGNHSTAIFKGLVRKEEYPDIHWFEHEVKTICGLKIFGSPYTCRFGDWAYMYNRNRGDQYWKHIPDDVDIVFTHGPPKYILDTTYALDNPKERIAGGCKALANRIEEIKPMIHAFGHFHDEKNVFNYGVLQRFGTYYINAACYNHYNKQIYNGHLMEI